MKRYDCINAKTKVTEVLESLFPKNLVQKIEEFSEVGFTFLGDEDGTVRSISEDNFYVSNIDNRRKGNERVFSEYNFMGELLNNRSYGWREDEKINTEIQGINPRHMRSYDLENVKQFYSPTKEDDMLYCRWDYDECEEYENYNEFEALLSEFQNPDEDEEWIYGFLHIRRLLAGGDKYEVLFVISNLATNRIISVAKFDGCKFTDGDSGTDVYLLNNGNILVCNFGDCPSVLFIKNNTPYQLEDNTNLKKILKSAWRLREHYKKYQKQIVYFLYQFFDEKEYTVWKYKNILNGLLNLPHKISFEYYVTKKDSEDRLVYVTQEHNLLHVENCLSGLSEYFDITDDISLSDVQRMIKLMT